MSFPTQESFPVDGHNLPTTTTEDTSHPPPPRVRRRNRQITSCLECRRRKLKCDKGSPCINCTKNGRPCVFIASELDADSKKRLAEVKEKMCILERSLEDEVARATRLKSGGSVVSGKSSTLPGQDEIYSDEEEDEETKDLASTHLATEDASYYQDGAAYDNDDLVDLGIAVGKLRITERIGGLVRPRFAEELTHALNELPKTDRRNPYPNPEQNISDWLAPSKDYVAPSSNLFFAADEMETSLLSHLPSRPQVDKFVAHYWQAAHVIAKSLHRPSFQRSYEEFWANIDANFEPRASFQAVVFAVLLTSAISMPDDKVRNDFGVDKQSLVETFRLGAESALSRANFLRATKLETLQAFAMYLIPLCRREVSRAHSALVGMLIRLAECMGLHRDPTKYTNSPVEIQVRRLVWYQICFLDLRTCEATGPRPQIRYDDYDTQFPLNIDDEELERVERGATGIDTKSDRKYFTDTTITRMRFECYEMHRCLWAERPKLEQKDANGVHKVTLISLLSRIQSFKRAMEKTYRPMLRSGKPLHALAAEVYGIVSDRLFIMLLQRYLSSGRAKMPSRLRELVLSSAVTMIEHSMVIEQQPALSTWSWYTGALHQYHSALLLLNELYAGPITPELEARIWKCLDWALGIDYDATNAEKTRFILEDLIAKIGIFNARKGVRVPTNMPQPESRMPTPGSEAKPQDEGQSGSPQSAGSTLVVLGHDTGGIPHPQQPQLPHRQTARPAGIAFPGAMPSVEWGSIDLPASTATFPQPQSSPPAQYSFNAYAPPVPSGGLGPATMLAQHEMDTNTPAAAIYGGMQTGTANSSPMDAIINIDSVDLERMFPGANCESGMLIPPFSFPQYSAGDFQWAQSQSM